MSENVINDTQVKQAQFQHKYMKNNCAKDSNLNNFATNALSAAGAAFLSVILVNPLDVAKTRLQAQAAGAQYAHPLSNPVGRMSFFGPTTMFADLRCSPTCTRAGTQGTVSICPPECFRYKGTLDVLYKIVRQVGIYLPFYDVFRSRMEDLAAENALSMQPYIPLVAGALARSLACTTCYPIELARTRMQAFKESGKKPPGVVKTLVGIVSNVNSPTNLQSTLRNFRVLWTGLGAQLARDVPYSALCWSTLEPMRRKLCTQMGDETSVLTVLGSNFMAGFIAGCFAAGATCPLDVARTRRQIEKDPLRALRMTTKQTIMEIWRDGGMRGLFAGVGPRVARAGPSVGIVVSFYEVVKHILQTRFNS
ncbi:hypothetical protein RND81_05G095000 [Saponaria officinalis]|uniref:Mitochondrial carrier protein MTM1 n=1 Tax=Saponaria officinalis TaxID=3572 RepID=A0AAW1KW43_SAPOF